MSDSSLNKVIGVIFCFFLSLVLVSPQIDLFSVKSADAQGPSPIVIARPQLEVIDGLDWPQGSSVDVCVDSSGFATDPTDTNQCDLYHASGTAELPFGSTQTLVQFSFFGSFDLAAGQYVTMGDGVTTLNHQVRDISVTTIDYAADEIIGAADPGSGVSVWANCSGCYTEATADGSGVWVADFSSLGDITLGSSGRVEQTENDGVTSIVWSFFAMPIVRVEPDAEIVTGRDFALGATTHLCIDDSGFASDPTNPGECNLYHGTKIPDPQGTTTSIVTFDLSSVVDIQAGHYVSMSDGTTTKEHLVTNLAITDVDVDTDIVSGTAEPGSEVSVSTQLNSSYCNETVTADGVGDWAVDFTGSCDIQPGSSGSAGQADGDWDSTSVFWELLNPYIEASPAWDQIEGMDWVEGETVHVCVDDSGFASDPTNPAQCSLFYETGLVEIPPGWSIPRVLFELDFDLQSGDFISMTDETTTKEHQVSNLVVSGADAAADTVYGTADPASEVAVNAWTDSGSCFESVTADGSGDWTADFSGSCDLQPGTSGSAVQYDDDNDRTYLYWSVANPIIQALPAVDRVDGWDWTVGETVHLCVNATGFSTDPTNPAQCSLYYDSMTAYEESWDPGVGRVSFDLDGILDVAAGQYISMAETGITKEHIVTALSFSDADPDTNIVSGTAAPLSDVEVWIYDSCPGCWQMTSADGSGNWSFDFTGIYDIVPGTQGAIAQTDSDYDETKFEWRVPNPIIDARPYWNSIEGNDWPAGEEIFLCVDETDLPGDPSNSSECSLYFDSATATPTWWNPTLAIASFDLDFDLQAGHYLGMTDGVTIKTHEITPLQVNGFDADLDTVSGTAAPGSSVGVWANGCSTNCNLSVTANGSGDWTADFNGLIDLEPGSTGAAAQRDDDNDRTYVYWQVRDPYIEVRPELGEAIGFDWPSGATLYVCLDSTDFPADPTNPSECSEFDGSALVEPAIWDPSRSFTQFDLSGVGPLDGLFITMSDGSVRKDYEIVPLEVTNADPDTDVVAGLTAPSTNIEVRVYECSGNCTQVVPSDGSGNWSADFSGSVDLVQGSYGVVVHYDADGDSTYLNWQILYPYIIVVPGEDYVYAVDFEEGSTVTLEVDDDSNSGNGVLFTDTRLVDDPIPFFSTFARFMIAGEFDVQPGHYVRMSDGTTSRSTLVTSVSIADVDPTTDIISGSSDSLDNISVVPDGEFGSIKNVSPNPSGDWSADFSGSFDLQVGSEAIAWQTDSEGNQTQAIGLAQVYGWEKLNYSSFDFYDTTIVSSLYEYGSELYAGAYNPTTGSQVWKQVNSWQEINSDGFGYVDNVGVERMVEFNGYLFAGVWGRDETHGGEIWRSSDGSTWNRVVSDGVGDPTNAEFNELYVFDSKLYAATWSWVDTHGAQIWRSSTGDTGSWSLVVPNGFGDIENSAITMLLEYNGYLYAAVGNGSEMGSTTGGSVWRSSSGDSGTWNQVSTIGFGDTGNQFVNALAEYNSKLYAITYHESGAGAEIWRCTLCDGSDWEQVVDNGLGDAEARSMSGFEVVGYQLYAVVGNMTDGLEVWRTVDGTNWDVIAEGGFGDADNTRPMWDYSIFNYQGDLHIGTINYANGGEIWRRKNFGAHITPGSDAKDGQPGAVIEYIIDVQNVGEEIDTFDIELNGNAWTTTADATIGPLDPGQTSTLSVFVTVPLTAVVGDSDSVQVRVNSQADPVQGAAGVFTSGVLPPGSPTANPVLSRLPGSIEAGSLPSGPNQWYVKVVPGVEGDEGDPFHFIVWLHVPVDWQLPWARTYSFTGDFASTVMSQDGAAQAWMETGGNCDPLSGAATSGYKWRAWSSPENLLPAAGERLNNQVNLRGGLRVPSGETADLYGEFLMVLGMHYDSDQDSVPDSYKCTGTIGTNITVP